MALLDGILSGFFEGRSFASDLVGNVLHASSSSWPTAADTTPRLAAWIYAEQDSPKYETAAPLRWLERYLTEDSPKLQHFAEITASLAKRELGRLIDSSA